MNWTTKTIDECCDFLAECKGWKHKGGRWYHPVYHKLGSDQKRHPIPATLDAIAGALPDEWVWCVVEFYDYKGVGAYARNKTRDDYVEDWTRAEANTELLARARAACMAWEAVLDQGADVAAQARGNRRAEE